MNSVPMPTTKELKEALLQVLRESPDGLSTAQIDMLVAKQLGLTQVQLQLKQSGNRSVISYRLAWERTNAKKLGLIELISKKTWKIR